MNLPPINSLGVDPALSRMSSADAALVQARDKMKSIQAAKLDETAKDFEAMFITDMLGQMFASIESDPLFGGGDAEDTWRSLMVEEYGKQIVRAGGIGLADSIKAEMIKMQEQAQ